MNILKRSTISAGKYVLYQKVGSLVLGVLLFMLLARTLAPGQFGVWGLFIIISSIIETLRYSLIRNGYVRFMNSNDQSERPAIEFAAILANVLFSLLIAVSFFLVAPLFEKTFHTPGMQTLLRYYSFSLLLLIPFSHIENRYYLALNFKAIFFMYLFRNLFLLLVVFFLPYFNVSTGFDILSLAYGASILVGMIPALFDSDWNLDIKPRWSKSVSAHYFKYGSFVFGTNFFSLIFVSTHNFLVSRFSSTQVLANYNVGTRVANLAEIPSQVFGDLFFPEATKTAGSGDKKAMCEVYENTVAGIVAILIPFVLAIIVLAKFIVWILAGTQYTDAIVVVRIMIVYSIFMGFLRQFGMVMDATGKPFVNTWVMAVGCLLNIGLNLAGLHFLGPIGAAVGTLAAHLVLFALTQFMLHRLFAVNVFRIFKKAIHLYPKIYQLTLSRLKMITGHSESK